MAKHKDFELETILEYKNNDNWVETYLDDSFFIKLNYWFDL